MSDSVAGSGVTDVSHLTNVCGRRASEPAVPARL
jgi:hypothetical protein